MNKKEKYERQFIISDFKIDIYAIENKVYFNDRDSNVGRVPYINRGSVPMIIKRLKQYLKMTALKPCKDCKYKYPKVEVSYNGRKPYYQVMCGKWECKKSRPRFGNYFEAIFDWNIHN